MLMSFAIATLTSSTAAVTPMSANTRRRMALGMASGENITPFSGPSLAGTAPQRLAPTGSRDGAWLRTSLFVAGSDSLNSATQRVGSKGGGAEIGSSPGPPPPSSLSGGSVTGETQMTNKPPMTSASKKAIGMYSSDEAPLMIAAP